MFSRIGQQDIKYKRNDYQYGQHANEGVDKGFDEGRNWIFLLFVFYLISSVNQLSVFYFFVGQSALACLEIAVYGVERLSRCQNTFSALNVLVSLLFLLFHIIPEFIG